MKQSLKSAQCLSILVVLLCSWSCARPAGSGPQANNIFPEFVIKQRLQADGPIPALSTFRQITNGAGGNFVVPSAITYSDVGDVYVADNNGQVVHCWKANSDRVEVFLTQKVGALNFPNAIQYENHKLYVSDNDGIKIFSEDGQFERLIRIYFGVFSFLITPKGTILVNALVREANDSDPLIVELDHTGKLMRGFGLRQNVPGHNGLEDQAFLAVSNSLLFVAFKHRPSVEVYDLDSGKLNRTLDISHPVFLNLANALMGKPNVNEKKLSGEAVIPKYLAGIRISGGRVFLCLYLPRPEIWEINDGGQRVAQFVVLTDSPALEIFGFDVRAMGGTVKISLGLTDPQLSPSVCEVNTIST